MPGIHESRHDGKPRPCVAKTIEACRARSSDGALARHYDSMEQYEKVMSEENSTFATINKKSSKDPLEETQTSRPKYDWQERSMLNLSPEDYYNKLRERKSVLDDIYFPMQDAWMASQPVDTEAMRRADGERCAIMFAILEQREVLNELYAKERDIRAGRRT